MKKFALISLGLPPSQSGQSMVLYHLLKKFNTENYILITLKNFHLYNNQGNCSTKLAAKYYFLSPDYQIIRLLEHSACVFRSRLLLDIILNFRKNQIKKILIKERCEAVIGCTGDLFDPPAAYLAAKELRIPFILYTFDFYSRQWTPPFLKVFSEENEKELLNGASRVIVPNKCMKNEYLTRYGVQASVIHNPFDLAEYERNAGTDVQNLSHEPQIVYTGAIYDANFTAFHNLITAMEKTKIPGLKLHVYTPQSENYLKKNAIKGPVEYHKHLPNSLIPAVQRAADILFLPLAFNSPYPEIIKTSAPGKIGEYLAAKKPVLVHAPQGSFVSWYFRHYRCGCVVDEDNPDKLAEAILRLFNDIELGKKLSVNAYTQAANDFDLLIAQKKIHDLLASL
jgi:glycosyltransferase involved in cell wall biosynthesis